MSEERKIVTVLFADCVGSTLLGEQLDPEELATVMHALFGEMRATIEAEGGVVEKFIGDAVMALFGVPSSHEDDPSRALRCALSMLEHLGPLNAWIERIHGVRLGLRIGVNTGEVLVSTEPGADLGMVTGDAVNVAARLEQRAEAGQILVAERTARSATGFRFEELGVLTVKGKASPVSARVLVDASPAAAPDGVLPGLSGLRAPMVGRDSELSLLQAVVGRSTREKRPHLVTIFGEAGVGKSRLAKELIAWAELGNDPPRVLRGRCLPYGDGSSYWPLAEILKGLAGVLDSDTREVVVDKLHAMGRALPEPANSDVVRLVHALAATAGIVEPGSTLATRSPGELRNELHDAWRTLLTLLATAQPLLVVIEDIHWGDDALMDLLEEVAGRARGAVVIICPSRPDLLGRRPAWGGEGRNASTISLAPLSREESDKLTSLLLDVDDLSEDLRARILERAEGNPFFLEEILRQLIDEERIVRQGERWLALDTASEVRIPDTVQSVLAARIDLLPPAAKRVLQNASVVGRVFWTGPLAAAGEPDLDVHLETLEARDLISTRIGSAFRGQRECIFRHVLTCNVAYDSIPRRDRPGLHAAVGEWLEDVANGREGEFAELVAHHWREAYRGSLGIPSLDSLEVERRRRLAHRWCLLASREADRRGVAERARTLAQHALDAAGSPQETADAAEALGDAYMILGEGSPAMAAFKLAADVLLAAGTPELERVAYLCARMTEYAGRWLGSLNEPFDAHDVWAYVSRGLELAGEGDTEAKARLLTVRAFWERDAPPGDGEAHLSPEQRERDAREASEMAARLGLADVESGALDALAYALRIQRRFREVSPVNQRRLALLPRLSRTVERGDTLCMAAWNAFDLGDYALAERHATAAVQDPDANAWGTILHALAWRSRVRLLLGAWDGVQDDVERAKEILRVGRVGQPPGFASATWAASAFIHAVRGDSQAADALLEALLPREGPRGTGPASAPTVALALARLGRIDPARWRLASVGDNADVPAETLVGLALLELAERDGGWRPAVDFTEDRLVSPEPEGPMPPDVAVAADIRGRLAAAAGDVDLAQAELARALESWARLGAIWPAARSQLALAKVLHSTGDPSARAHLSHALAVFERLNALEEIAQATLLLAH